MTDPSTDQSSREDAPADRYVALLAAEGIDASVTTIRGDEIESWLAGIGDRVPDAVLVATSVRWTEPEVHGRSMTQRLVHRSTRPVLVVPARYAPWLPQAKPSAPARPLPVDRIDELTAQECWDLLRSTSIGRLAVCISGRPGIFPVNFVVDEQTIVFRTAEGTKLSALSNVRVAFEIDDYDPDSGQAGSVIVEGRAAEITDAGDRRRCARVAAVPVARRAEGALRADHPRPGDRASLPRRLRHTPGIAQRLTPGAGSPPEWRHGGPPGRPCSRGEPGPGQ